MGLATPELTLEASAEALELPPSTKLGVCVPKPGVIPVLPPERFASRAAPVAGVCEEPSKDPTNFDLAPCSFIARRWSSRMASNKEVPTPLPDPAKAEPGVDKPPRLRAERSTNRGEGSLMLLGVGCGEVIGVAIAAANVFWGNGDHDDDDEDRL
mmetsp:Transcript_24508/g.53317  ORF Transcript_24508/g.53317 Transcript_24508/m.53317 type:complete len:155 (+) Transcript_24508:1056-1520(+)